MRRPLREGKEEEEKEKEEEGKGIEGKRAREDGRSRGRRQREEKEEEKEDLAAFNVRGLKVLLSVIAADIQDPIVIRLFHFGLRLDGLDGLENCRERHESCVWV